MYIYSFEKLEVWKDSKSLVKSVYEVTTCFPSNEKYGLISQLRRSAISIPSNIAEGTSRKTAKDKAHFMTLAFSSAMELLNQLILSYELNFVSRQDYEMLRLQVEKVTNKLNALRNYHFSK